MSTTSPPPAPPSSPAPPLPPPPPGRGAARTVSTAVVVVGALVLAGGAVSAAGSTVTSALRVDDTLVASAEGVGRLDVEASGARVDVLFGEVDQARLDVRGSRGTWRLERDGDLLRLGTPDGPFRGWSFGWGRDDGRATLTLPAALDGSLDAGLDVGGGELRATGAFDDVRVDLGAGGVFLDGSVTSLDADVAAGRLEADVTDVESVALEVAAGSAVAALGGTAPETVAVDVSAGSLDLGLPPATYAVRQDVAAGSLDNRLDTSASAPHDVEVSVAAGTVVLREHR